mmetsp:Transcript_30099/g.52889  ORF Transcript_30099/g.52889 Transcript_30099/m.52889 type:complete len:541 (-) Transcript_30099:178-1800(-)
MAEEGEAEQLIPRAEDDEKHYEPTILKPSIADRRSHSPVLQAVLIVAAVHVLATTTYYTYAGFHEDNYKGWNQVLAFVAYLLACATGYVFLILASAGNNPSPEREDGIDFYMCILSMATVIAYFVTLAVLTSQVQFHKSTYMEIQSALVIILLPISIAALTLYSLLMCGYLQRFRQTPSEPPREPRNGVERVWNILYIRTGARDLFTNHYPPLLVAALILGLLCVVAILIILWHVPGWISHRAHNVENYINDIKGDLSHSSQKLNHDAEKFLDNIKSVASFISNNADSAGSVAFIVSLYSGVSYLIRAASTYAKLYQKCARMDAEDEDEDSRQARSNRKARIIGLYVVYVCGQVLLSYVITIVITILAAVLGTVSGGKWLGGHTLGLVCYVILFLFYHMLEAATSPTFLAGLSLVYLALSPVSLALRIVVAVLRITLGGALHIGKKSKNLSFLTCGVKKQDPTALLLLVNSAVQSARALGFTTGAVGVQESRIDVNETKRRGSGRTRGETSNRGRGQRTNGTATTSRAEDGAISYDGAAL